MLQELSISSIVEDDVTNSLPVSNVYGQKMPRSPSESHIISVGRLLESVSFFWLPRVGIL